MTEKKSFKRYCKYLTLKDEPELIKQYKEAHDIGKAWPEITKGMKEIGILDMEIYIHENKLFMIMDTVADFDHDKAMNKLAKKPGQSEWEAFVSRFQVTTENASSKKKWQLMERIFELNQKEKFKAEDGQLKTI